jgi:hypothetical protein
MRHSCGSCALRSRLRARVRSKSLRGSAVCTSLGRGEANEEGASVSHFACQARCGEQQCGQGTHPVSKPSNAGCSSCSVGRARDAPSSVAREAVPKR